MKLLDAGELKEIMVCQKIYLIFATTVIHHCLYILPVSTLIILAPRGPFSKL